MKLTILQDLWPSIMNALSAIPADYVTIGGTGLAAVGIPYMTYKYFFPTLNYWEKQGVPCYNPGARALLYDTRKPLHEHEWDLYTRYGKVYGRYDGRLPVLTVADPVVYRDVMEYNFASFQNRRSIQFGDPIMDNILSTLNDADWRRVRSIFSSALTEARMKAWSPGLEACVQRSLLVLNRLRDENKPVDVERWSGSYVLDAISSCAFGSRILDLETKDNKFISHAHNFFQEGNPKASVLAQYFPFVMSLLKIPVFNKDTVQFFRKFVVDRIKERKEDPANANLRRDFIQALLGQDPRSGFVKQLATKQQITEPEVIAQCIMIFMAGYETTLSLMQFLMYILAYNPEVQDRLYSEIQAEIPRLEQGANLVEVVFGMKYMEAVIFEGLRMGNPCIRMERRAMCKHFVKDYNISLKKNDLISIPFYCVHMDSQNYEDPQEFRPERFLGAEKSMNESINLGFGMGPRSCPGIHFAMAETKTLLCLLLKEFQILPCPKTGPPLSYRVRQKTTLVPDKVWVNVQKRSSPTTSPSKTESPVKAGSCASAAPVESVIGEEGPRSESPVPPVSGEERSSESAAPVEKVAEEQEQLASAAANADVK